MHRIFLFILVFLLAGGNTVFARKAEPVSHVVIIWLKHPGNVADQDTLIQASRAFRKLRGVKEVKVGRGMRVDRPGAGQNFDIAVLITFRNPAALERYEKDPRHLLAVKQILKPLARRYVVYNSLLQ